MADFTGKNLTKVLQFGANGTQYYIDAYALANHDADEWGALYDLVMAADNDNVINNLQELLDIFNNYPEADNILTILSNKTDKTHTHGLQDVKGTVSQPTFTGTQATITVSGKSAGSVSIKTQTGSDTAQTNAYTPKGTIKDISYKPTGTISGTTDFEGSASATSSTGAAVATSTHTHALTATGTISTAAPQNGETATYKPAGTISAPKLNSGSDNTGAVSDTVDVAGQDHTHTVSGSATISVGTGTANYTPSGSVKGGAFVGETTTFSGSYTPEGTVTSTFTGDELTSTGSFKPSGSVSKPTITVTPSTTKINAVKTWSAGSLPTLGSETTVVTGVGTFSQGSLQTLKASLSNGVLTISLDGGALPSLGTHSTTKIKPVTGAGTLPSLETEEVSVMTGASATSSQPTFTGTSGSVSVKGTPSGTVGSTFKGTTKNVSTSGTPLGSNTELSFAGTGVQLKATISGTAAKTETSNLVPVASDEHVHSYTKATSVSAPTFDGTSVMFKFNGSSATTSSITGTTTVASLDHIHKVTTAVNFSKATFEGTTATLSTTFTGTAASFVATFTGSSHNSTATFTPAGTVSQPTFTFVSGSTKAAN